MGEHFSEEFSLDSRISINTNGFVTPLLEITIFVYRNLELQFHSNMFVVFW